MKQMLKQICIVLSLSLACQLAMPAVAAEGDLTEETVQTELAEVTELVAETRTEDPEALDAVEETQPETVPEETLVEEEPEEDEEIEEESWEEESEEENMEWPEYLKVPLYFQTDYPETMYGAGSVATSGCSITALSMVATYLTGHEYLPDELAYYFGGSAENNMERLENGSEALQLPFYKAENWHYTLEALHEGKIAIALMEMNSKFTTSQHFIVLTGVNEDGRIMVNDPYEPNYSKWDLEDGFIYGFEEHEILQGYSGAWIYDKSEMPEEPFIYSEPMPDPANARYPDIDLTLEEMRLLARVIWVEARGESDEGQQAVAEVVLNRIASDSFPDTLEGVIYAEGQFRSLPYLKDAEPYQAQYKAIERAMYGPYVLPEDVVHFATYKATDYVWGKIGGHYFCYDWDCSGE